MILSWNSLSASIIIKSFRSKSKHYFRQGQQQKKKYHHRSCSSLNIIPSWATLDPDSLGNCPNDIHYVSNMVGGKWQDERDHSNQMMSIPDPLDKNKHPIFKISDISTTKELEPFIQSLNSVCKSGQHNPLKNPERYLMYGEISRQAGNALSEPDVADFFARSIMKCVPKSYSQAIGEVKVTASFLNNFAGDNVRFLARSFGNPGDHYGQQSNGYRWPYGPVAIISPFNFPLEIPVLQLMGSLFMGNKPVLKPSEKVAIVMEQYLHLLHHCGMPKEDVDYLNCQGHVAERLILQSNVRLTQFTGSSLVAEQLSRKTGGKVKMEDAGFDWKILGPDVSDVDYVAWQCDQDAYATQGQKCSAQSILFLHENWDETDLIHQMKTNASKRTLNDLTMGPVLTHTTQELMDHIQQLLTIPGASLLFGGNEIDNHCIPDVYGAMEPTAVFVPLKEMLKEDHFEICTTELFAPFQVVTRFEHEEVDLVLEACERMSHHLTAAIVSNDEDFQTKILANTVNGTTYVGKRARTTGAPQNHWFGPAGDPRGAGIGTPESIQSVWSCHREIIRDTLIPHDWVPPKPT